MRTSLLKRMKHAAPYTSFDSPNVGCRGVVAGKLRPFIDLMDLLDERDAALHELTVKSTRRSSSVESTSEVDISAENLQ